MSDSIPVTMVMAAVIGQPDKDRTANRRGRRLETLDSPHVPAAALSSLSLLPPLTLTTHGQPQPARRQTSESQNPGREERCSFPSRGTRF